MNQLINKHPRHEIYMDRCIQLANRAIIEGNPPVGSLLVKDNKILAEGIEAGKSRGDVTAHAEIEVFKNALIRGIKDFSECILYSTHEPCVMCSYAIRHYKIKILVYGVEVEELGGQSSKYSLLTDSTIIKWDKPPIIIKGIGEKEIEKLNSIYKMKCQ